MNEEKVTSLDINDNFLRLTYSGGLQLEEIIVRKSSIVAVQKPKSNKFGCIVQMLGDKYPVKESYEEVVSLLQ